MSARYRLTPAAQRDVESILLEVEERFGSVVADRVYDDFLRALRLLGRMPDLGHLRLDLWPEPFRFWPIGPSLIAYLDRLPSRRATDSDRADRPCFARLVALRPERMRCEASGARAAGA